MKKYLNLGCGSRFHPAWTNVDFVSTSEYVIAHDLSHGIPFPDDYFDVVYHSHLLEHISKTEAEPFMRECCRVLRSGGVLRIVVPDLELLARTYLEVLESACGGSPGTNANYEWILLHLYDQTVRSISGGEMARYLSNPDIPNIEFVLSMIGKEANNILYGRTIKKSFFEKIKSQKFSQLIRKMNRKIRNSVSKTLVRIISGKEALHAFEEGLFRKSGEVHQWMYDRYSLSMLLKKCGLQNVIQRSASESYIHEWSTFNLDTEPDGTIYRPDSLFMEAVKP